VSSGGAGQADGTRIAIAAAAITALFLGVATAREIHAGVEAVIDSDAAAARGDLAAATARARDAAEAAAPGSPYPREGYTRLEAIARGAEARRDERGAIAAWGAMRAAATATGAPLVSTDAWRALADEGIVRTGAQVEGSPGEVHASEDTLRTSLAREDAPATGILALLGAGAAAFFAGLGRLAFTARNVATLRREKLALAAALVGGLLYAVVCLRA
jgi:hypothetical protein